MKRKILFLTLFFISGNCIAQSIFEPQEAVRNRYTPSTSDLDDASDFQKKYKSENDKRLQLQKELDDIKKQSRSQNMQTTQSITVSQQEVTPVLPSIAEKPSTIVGTKIFDLNSASNLPVLTSKKNIQKENSNSSVAIYQHPLIFGISAKMQDILEKKTIIPAGSYVKVRILTGVEASSNPQTPYPMLMQADYAFTGPNKTKIDMSNCFLMAKTTGDLSTERVIGQVDMLSCVRRNGKYEERPAQGYLAGEDSTFGVIGQLISKQGQVLAAAVIASLAKGASDALATVQTTTSVVAGTTGAPVSATNVTGNTAAFVAGRAFTDSASLVAQWYLKYAEQLVPAIAVGSGRSIWVVLQKSIEIPQLDSEAEN